VDEFHAKMKPFFRKIRPKEFQDADPTQKVDWDALILEESKNAAKKNNSR
jgi:hypothetical protein